MNFSKQLQQTISGVREDLQTLREEVIPETTQFIKSLPTHVYSRVYGTCLGMAAGMGAFRFAEAKDPSRIQSNTMRLNPSKFAGVEMVKDDGYHPQHTKALVSQGSTLVVPDPVFKMALETAVEIAEMLKRPSPRIEDLSRMSGPSLEL
jgi:hypothetical protein